MTETNVLWQIVVPRLIGYTVDVCFIICPKNVDPIELFRNKFHDFKYASPELDQLGDTTREECIGELNTIHKEDLQIIKSAFLNETQPAILVEPLEPLCIKVEIPQPATKSTSLVASLQQVLRHHEGLPSVEMLAVLDWAKVWTLENLYKDEN